MSLQLKLNLMITSLLLVLLGVSAYFIINNAKEDVRAEVASTANLALHLLDAQVLHYSSDFGWINNESGRSIFRLQSLGNIRHLSIDFFDINGKLRETNRKSLSKSSENAPPAWFVKAIGITNFSIPKQTRNIVLNGRYVGELVVTPDPSYEIEEVWDDTVGLLGLIAIIFLVINTLVYVLVKYTFKPVDTIKEALSQMELGQLAARLPAFKQVELHEIGQKFNVMAETLQVSIENNHHLTQQLIRLQEDERSSLARDIHDEIGQFLTAINVEASVILNSKKIVQAKESAQAIGNLSRQIMDAVHEMLQRLRPRALDELGLSLALGELVGHWRERFKNVSIVQNIAGDIGYLDESVSITIYRVVQECLTNIAKHADARRVTIHLKQDDKLIYLLVADDGVGFDTSATTQGFGLAGMKERIQGLSGKMNVDSAMSCGTTITVTLPKQVHTESTH